MKKEELLAMGLTEEQAAKVFELNGKAVEKAKGKSAEQEKELESLRTQLEEKDQTIANLEKAGGDAKKMAEELEKYKQAEAERKRAEKEAETDQILTAAAEQALEGKEFINDYTRAHFVAELKKAIADPANKGKSPAKLFEAMTKDADGIFRNPQQEPLKIPKVDNHLGKPMTREEIDKIKDAGQRQAAIAANIGLYRKDE